MVTAVNHRTNTQAGTTQIEGGRYSGDVGVLLIGDSNLCGAGGGTRPTPVNTLYEWNNTANQIQQIGGSPPLFDHTLNDGADEVGPDVSFVDKFATERGNGRRVVGLPCGDSGSGFSTAQWFDTEQMYELMQEICNEFYAANSGNTIEAVLIVLGANDTGDFTPDTLWRDHLDNLIDAIRATAFNYSAVQPSLATVPIVVCGLPPDWYTGVSARQAIHNHIVGTPTRKTYTGYASTDGLASQSGDAIHLSGASNITLGGTNAWTAFIAAEANT